MKSKSFDIYGGLLPAGFVSDNAHPVTKSQWPNNPEFWTGNPVKELPATAKRMVGVVLSISSFATEITGSMSMFSGKIQPWSGLHVGVWLSLGDKPVGKECDGVFAFGNTGDSGACNISIMDLDIPVTDGKLTINWWAHNMRSNRSDWHANFIIYYEES